MEGGILWGFGLLVGGMEEGCGEGVGDGVMKIGGIDRCMLS